MKPAHFILALLAMLAGVIAWALHFTIVYGAATLACTPHLGWNFSFGKAAALILSLAALGALAAYGLRHADSWLRDRADTLAFMTKAAAVIMTLAFIAIAWGSLPWLFFSDCR